MLDDEARRAQKVILRGTGNGHRFHVVTHFHAGFVDWARKHGGRWMKQSKVWTFPNEQAEAVYQKCGTLWGFHNIRQE